MDASRSSGTIMKATGVGPYDRDLLNPSLIKIDKRSVLAHLTSLPIGRMKFHRHLENSHGTQHRANVLFR